MDEPQVAIFDSGTRTWRYENEYPIARTRWTDMYLHAEDGEGALRSDAPSGDEQPDSYRMPDSYAQLAKGEAVLSYTTAPMEQDLRLSGPMSLTLYGASSQPDTAWYAYLRDIPPDGPPAPVSVGKLKASFRSVDEGRSGPAQPFHPFEKQELLEPGTIYEFRIELVPAFRTLRKGHRLELRIASEDITYNNPLRQIDVHLLPWPVENQVHHRHPILHT